MSAQSNIILPLTEKYRPKQFDDFIGNRKVVAELENWLRTWKSQRKKAALLIGPAGTGKTSVMLYLAAKYNFETVEVNASDKRNKAAVDLLVGKSSTEGTINQGAIVRKLILVDEADGLFGNNDRGGGKALENAIKNTQIPIICTANDPEANSLKGIKKIMKEFVFERLSTLDIEHMLIHMVKQEGFTIHAALVKEIAQKSRGDARSAINDLEGLAFVNDPNELIDLSTRNQEKKLETALVEIFRANTLKEARESIEGLDIEYNELLQYVFENAHKQAKTVDELEAMYSLIAEADLYLKRCYVLQEWQLLKYFFTFIAAVGTKKESAYVYTAKFAYPSYWAKMFRAKAKAVKVKAMAENAKGILHCSKSGFETDFYPYIKLIFLSNAKKAAEIAVYLRFEPEIIEFLAEEKRQIDAIKKEYEIAYLKMAEHSIHEKQVEPPLWLTSSLDDATRKKRKDEQETIKNVVEEQVSRVEVVDDSIKSEIADKTENLEETEERTPIKKKKKQGQTSLESFF